MTTILGPFFILFLFTTCVHAATRRYTLILSREQRVRFNYYVSDCAKQLEKEQRLKADYALESELQCPIHFKNLICWPSTPANTTVSLPCPDYLPSTAGNATVLWFCNANGSWPVVDWEDTMSVSQCYRGIRKGLVVEKVKEKEVKEKKYDDWPMFKEHAPYLVIIQTIGLSVSIVALAAACFTLVFLKMLKHPKIVIHMNLFMSCLCRATINLLVLRLTEVYREEVEECRENSDFTPLWKWKLLVALWMYSRVANSIWILIEAVYLILLLFVPTFSDKSSVKWFAMGGWCAPLLFVIPWVIIRTSVDDFQLWTTFSKDGELNKQLRWIIEAPIALVILINCIIFVIVLRLLFAKLLDCQFTKVQRYLKLIKSALMLIPLFGIHYIVSFFLVFVDLQNNYSTAVTVCVYFELCIASVQGLIVSILYCFINDDIRFELLKKWFRWRLMKNVPRRRNQLSMSTDRRSSIVSESSVLPRSKRRHSSVYSLNQTSTNNEQSEAFGILSLEEQCQLLSLTARPNLEQADLNQNEVKLCDDNNDEGGSTSGEENI